MSFVKRTVLYLTRKKCRTILLTVLMFIMSCFVLIGISLKNSADKEIELLRQSLGTSFTLKADFENDIYYEPREGKGFNYKAFAGPTATEQMIQQILEIDGVDAYNAGREIVVWVGLELEPASWANTKIDDYFTEKKLEVFKHTTLACSRLNGELDPNFRTGAIRISEGRNIQEDDSFKAVISEELAKRNHLAVGDTIILESKEGMFQPSKEPLKRWGEPVEVEIVGLFHMNFKQKTSEYTAEFELLENMIYTDFNTRNILNKNIGKMEEEKTFDKVTFWVKDPTMRDFVMEQVKEKVDISGLILKEDDSAYKASIKPLRVISVFAVLLLITGIVGIGIILYLVMSFWIKERKQEMGILMSIGIRKKNMIVQMLLENLMVAAVALILSISLSGFMVDKCARMAENLTAPKANTENYIVTPLGMETMPTATKTSSEKVELDHNVSLETIFFTAIVVCGISSISVFCSSAKVLRMEPKKLLQSM